MTDINQKITMKQENIGEETLIEEDENVLNKVTINPKKKEYLEKDFEKIDCDNEKIYSDKCNKFLLKRELLENQFLSENPDTDTYLYPNLSDTNFNIKISSKKEFNDTKYDGTIHDNIKEQADMLAKAEFELSPHQAFVKNFMSFQTPYNSLLLYHGLGTGKTCSAIGVCEEMRDYMKQMGITKRIIIVASENVQDNFRLQLFDERKLKLVDGLWNIKACTGNKLLSEINPMNMKGITREKIISQIKTLINTYYIFLGYGQFANYIIKTMSYNEEMKREYSKRMKDQLKNPNIQEKEKEKGKKGKTQIQMLKDVKITLNDRIIRRLRNEFENRLIVIDEVHNIRKTDDNENKKVALNLELLVKSVQNMRLLLLSATPMYNSYKEIVWLLNIMNINDRRARVDVSDIFDKNGNFKKDGEEMLIRKATGYISFVRGENPYTFPYRVYPNSFFKERTFPSIPYPEYQMNMKRIKHEDKNRILSLYLNTIGNCDNCGECQACAYKYIIHHLRNKSFTITTKKGVVRDMPSFENMESFGYTLLQTPLEALIISYPIEGLKSILDSIPEKTYSSDFSPSFSESIEQELEEEVGEEEEVVEKGQVEELEKEINQEDNSDNELVEELEDEEKEDILKTKLNPLKIQSSSNSNTDESSISSKGGAISSPTENVLDPHDLTGKKGLERMMRFIDIKSPPQKGSYEYKASTIKQYGKIFSQQTIGKYSSKIKNILDSILNPETGVVSEGIILIYSQYIDSGLIPMALALEEMGFVRYGQNTKPLFKNKPSDYVDVRTMRPPQDKKNFMPARYSMITGDPRLSPDNDYEVKGLTNDDNKEGSKIKVILISKAGSEGIDLKFIRQVHILEPWYNMNRLEQIIGRAVRNFSHKDLPFEKRNVEIFMYGTILDDNKEETADLYVYRVAEFKAIQIGTVNRVLKETAVDCLINHDQTNFTQEMISANLKQPITQILSTGITLDDFKVGDAPFSPACDYMASCNYSCRPDKSIDENNLDEDTYNETFIIMNSEKILQKIRMLMKESFFYKKNILINAIRTPKEYPLVQIYSALTYLIENKNEFILDKYGRNGRLINIGEYYLFQPIELRDNNSSLFDRSVPIDYKHEMIKFEIKKNIEKPIVSKKTIGKKIMEIEEEKGEEKESKRENVIENNKKTQKVQIFEKEKDILSEEFLRTIDELKANYNITIEFTKQIKVPRGDDNWYKHCGIVMKKLSREYPKSTQYLKEMLASHIIELLLFEDKINILNYLYSLDNIQADSFEFYAKNYFERISIKTKDAHALIFYNLNKRVIVELNEHNVWSEMGNEDQINLASSREAKKVLSFNKEDFNKYVGFIGYEKKNKFLVFKTKDMDSTRDTGARCDESGKDKTIQKLNSILGETKYTNENTKMVKDADGNVIREAVGHTELCVITEFLLRYFDITKKDGKKWLLTPEMALYHKLYKIFV